MKVYGVGHHANLKNTPTFCRMSEYFCVKCAIYKFNQSISRETSPYLQRTDSVFHSIDSFCNLCIMHLGFKHIFGGNYEPDQ